MNTNISQKIKPIIFWYGFPVCGLLIKKVADIYGDDLIIVSTKTEFPFLGLESELGHPIIWLDNQNDIWIRRAEFSDRNFVIHTGWVYPGWLKYDRYIKKINNAKIVVAVDNRYRGDLKQWLGALYFRIYLKKFFDAVIVPGKQGKKLMHFLGMPISRIYTGLYGAYEKIFKDINPIEKRNNEFLFVGQLNKRKSVDILIEAFHKYKRLGGTWNLRIVGSGPLSHLCQGNGIILESFNQPDNIAQKMNSAKVLVLPSRDDNWGTVVCEAAACGMHIISTKTVGASDDIVQHGINGWILKDITVSDLSNVFFHFENLPTELIHSGSEISKSIATHYTSNNYFQTFTTIISDLFDKK